MGRYWPPISLLLDYSIVLLPHLTRIMSNSASPVSEHTDSLFPNHEGSTDGLLGNLDNNDLDHDLGSFGNHDHDMHDEFLPALSDHDDNDNSADVNDIHSFGDPSADPGSPSLGDNADSGSGSNSNADATTVASPGPGEDQNKAIPDANPLESVSDEKASKSPESQHGAHTSASPVTQNSSAVQPDIKSEPETTTNDASPAEKSSVNMTQEESGGDKQPPAPADVIIEESEANADAQMTEAGSPALGKDSADQTTIPQNDLQQDSHPDVKQEVKKISRNEQEKLDKPQAPQVHTIVIPSYATWFNMDKINEIEIKSLPEFFSGKNRSKTPKTYQKYRDFMINVYRLNPFEYLTVTASRRHLVGDVGAIMRVHSFLEKWGLINYQVAVQSRPSDVVPPVTGHWNQTLDTPRGMFPFQFYKGTKDSAAQPNNGTITSSGNLTNGNEASSKSSKPSTDAAPPATMTSETSSDPKWSKTEIIKLLDAIMETPNDWKAISDAVGPSKSREDCLLKFLSVSAEDSYLQNGFTSTDGSKDYTSKLGPLKYDSSHIPFTQADNPVMSVASFLAGLVEPKVAAAASGRTIEELKKIRDKYVEEANKTDQENKENKEEGGDEQDNGDKKAGAGADDNTSLLESAANTSLGVLGGRGYALATKAEREMNQLYTRIVSSQLAKVDLKMEKFDKIEKSLDLERRALEREREDLFLDRLSLQKKVNVVDGLLKRALADLSRAVEDGSFASNSESLRNAFVDQISAAKTVVASSARSYSKENPIDQGESHANIKEDLKPVSVDLPQTYKYWSA